MANNSIARIIKKQNPQYSDELALCIAEDFKIYLRNGFNYIRPLRVILLIIIFAIISSCTLILLMFIGIIENLMMSDFNIYLGMVISGLWAYILIKYEKRKLLRDFIKRWVNKNA